MPNLALSHKVIAKQKYILEYYWLVGKTGRPHPKSPYEKEEEYLGIANQYFTYVSATIHSSILQTANAITPQNRSFIETKILFLISSLVRILRVEKGLKQSAIKVIFFSVL